MIPIKPATIRRLTRLAKSLYPTLARIPRPLPRPGSQAYLAPKEFNTSDSAQLREQTYIEADSRRLDKGTISFWATPYTTEDRRR